MQFVYSTIDITGGDDISPLPLIELDDNIQDIEIVGGQIKICSSIIENNELLRKSFQITGSASTNAKHSTNKKAVVESSKPESNQNCILDDISIVEESSTIIDNGIVGNDSMSIIADLTDEKHTSENCIFE